MYRSGQMELESSGWMQSRVGERPAFQALVSRGFSSRMLHVFLMPQGFLFLQKLKRRQNDGDTMRNAVAAGAAVGGLMGAMMGAALASASNRPVEEDENFEMSANDHIHSRRSAHYAGFAVDLHSSDLDALARTMRSAGYHVLWRVPGHYGHVHVEDPGYQMKEEARALNPRRSGKRVAN